MATAMNMDAAEAYLNEQRNGWRKEDIAERQRKANLDGYLVTLREPEVYPRHRANPLAPSLALTEGVSFPFPRVDVGVPEKPSLLGGSLSPKTELAVIAHLEDAASKSDHRSRDAATGRAASAIAKDWDAKHGKENLLSSARQELQAQAMFVSRELGAKIGLGPAESSVIGYSLERALEKEGFKVFASHAVDKMSDVFKSTVTSNAHASGVRATLENKLNDSMNWLASKGVTREAFKDAIGKHSGKLTVMAEVFTNPQAFQRAAQVMASSDKVFDGLMNVASDKEFRQALGTLSLSAGETVGTLHKGLGSAAILAGAALKGESKEDMGRHAFRAALSVIGGAAGGIALGAVSAGFGSVAGAVGGSALGSSLADKLISLYDKYTGHTPEKEQPLVTQQERDASLAVVRDRAEAKAQDVVMDTRQSMSERAQDMGREMTYEKTGKPA